MFLVKQKDVNNNKKMFNLTTKITKKWRCLLAKEVFEKKMKTFVCACLCVLSHMTMRICG